MGTGSGRGAVGYREWERGCWVQGVGEELLGTGSGRGAVGHREWARGCWVQGVGEGLLGTGSGLFGTLLSLGFLPVDPCDYMPAAVII